MPPRIRAFVRVPNTNRAIFTDVGRACPAMSYETISRARLCWANANDRNRSLTRWERMPRMSLVVFSLRMKAARGGRRKYSFCRTLQNVRGNDRRFCKNATKNKCWQLLEGECGNRPILKYATKASYLSSGFFERSYKRGFVNREGVRGRSQCVESHWFLRRSR